MRQLAEPFPAVRRQLRTCTVRLALRRLFVQLARAEASSPLRAPTPVGPPVSHGAMPARVAAEPQMQLAAADAHKSLLPPIASHFRHLEAAEAPHSLTHRVEAVETELKGVNAKLDAIQEQLALMIRTLPRR